MNTLLESAILSGASDLHISTDQIAKVRINGELYNITPITEPNILYSPLELLEQINLLLGYHDQIRLSDIYIKKAFNISCKFNEQFRIRINISQHYHGIACAMRIINNNIKSLDDISVPPQLKQITQYNNGLVIITGKTGSGKSTTIANVIQSINLNQRKHIITLEDPIEFVYHNQNSLIHQIELNTHTSNLETALVEALRQDPNIIVIGELRTKESIKQALYAAEAGHLVISTLHSNSATDAINRMIHFLDDHERIVLATTLKAVIAQKLIMLNNSYFTANYEILFTTHAIQNLIIEGKTAQINNILSASKNQGMLTFEQHLQELKNLLI